MSGEGRRSVPGPYDGVPPRSRNEGRGDFQLRGGKGDAGMCGNFLSVDSSKGNLELSGKFGPLVL